MAIEYITPSLNVTGIVIGTFGGLALFLYGMDKMSDGLQAVAGESMKTLLSRLTTNRYMAAITGAFVTAVLQSSSITTVLVVGFVGAGLMTLGQTVGVIMGANVGTTVTAQMLAFNITELAWLMVALGFASWSFARRDVMRNVGTMLMGFGLLFIGMDQMGEATRPLRSHQPFIELMSQMDHVVLAMLVGAAFTALVQSSSATIGIVIMLATQGQITLEAGIALGIGSKIGTCVTALLAGIGKPSEAQRVGVVHVLFNLLGAFMWLPFIALLGVAAAAVSPAYPELLGIERLAAETPRQVANAITIFAIVNLSVMIWFTGPIARLAEKLVRDRPVPEPDRVRKKYLDPVFFRTPALAIEQVRLELTHLGENVLKMLEIAPGAVAQGTHEDLDRVAEMDEDVNYLHAEILTYISVLAREELKTVEARRLEHEIEIANHLEAIGDLVKANLVAQGRRRLELNLEPADTDMTDLKPLYEAVALTLRDVLLALADGDTSLAQEVISRKGRIRRLGNEASAGIAGELLGGNADTIMQFRVESDIIQQLMRIFYHVKHIGKSITADNPTQAE
jgi:phosphate:Na+ symporter